MAVARGTRLGPYEILDKVGAGGMGEVYRARDTRLDRTVAVKVLPADRLDDPQARQRFDREARTVAALNHQHICHLHDVGHQDGVDYLVMEFLEGETLASRLSRGGTAKPAGLPIEEVLRHGVQIADALSDAHRHGIVHRDLKPGNMGAGVNTAFNEAGPWIHQVGNSGLTTLYFDSNRPADPLQFGPFTDDGLAHNGNDIYASTLQHDRTFGPAAPAPNVNTTSLDRRPSISRDGLEMFLGSSRPGGFGNLDVWVSTRETRSAPWSTPVNLGPTVNTATSDAGPAIATDGKTLFFQSVPPGAAGFDIYVATRTPVQ
jgi:hypothetical protein